MKFAKLLLMIVLASAAWTACKKDSTVPAFTMEGTWKGKIGNGTVVPASQFELNIKPGGLIERISGSGNVSASGTWQLNGNSFSATYSYSSGTVVMATATVDKAQNKITGNWENQSEQGTFTATKQ